MVKFIWAVFGVLLALWTCDAYRILVIFPVPARSHGILGDGVVRYLLEGGHEVTYITPFLKKNPPPNLHQVDVSSNEKVFNADTLDVKSIMDKTFDFKDVRVILNLMTSISEATVTNDNVQKLLKDPNQQFDVVLAEWMFTEIYSAIPAVFDCPLIWFSTLQPHWMILSLIDEPPNPAYNADYLKTYAQPFTFSQRINELWSQITWRYHRNNFFYNQEHAYKSYIAPILRTKGKRVASLEELRYNASLVLGNSHVSMGQATRLPQNYKAVGGYHVETTTKPLPEDLKIIMNNSKNGVIYFSLGSNLKSKDLPVELKHNLLKVFGELKQTVLWKFEEKLPNLPQNVHILKWAPQQSILSHPNCVLFITHGGLLSTTEATHYGVPIIGIPVFADQFKNVDTTVLNGFGIKIELSYTMADELRAAIVKMTSDSSYRKRIKEISLIYHDRPVSPGAELLHWVEHVVRTGGAPYLRSPALHMPWYQKMYLDLFAVMVVIVFLFAAVLKRLYCIIVIKRIKSKLD